MLGFPHTVVRVRAHRRQDSMGMSVEQRDWSAGSRVTLHGWSIQPMSSTEARANGVTAVTSAYRGFSDPSYGDQDVQAGDRIEHGALVLDVVGEPARWPSLSGGVHHVELMLQVAPPTQGVGQGGRQQVAAGLLGAAQTRGWAP